MDLPLSGGTLDPGIPLVALVFPIAAAAAADLGETVDRLDPHHEFRVLVAKLPLDAQANGRAVGDRQRLVIEFIGEDGLLVIGVDAIDAPVLEVPPEPIRAMEDEVARLRLEADAVEERAETGAFPLADAAPAFDAVMGRDLRARLKLP